MGAMESCCGKRRPADMPSMPTKPVSALGNQYVTFNPEQPELFIMRQKIWTSHQPFDVKDISLNDWFKIEGKDAQVRTASSLTPKSVAFPLRFLQNSCASLHCTGCAHMSTVRARQRVLARLHSPARCIF